MSGFKNIENIWHEQQSQEKIPDALTIKNKTEKMRRKVIIKHSIGIGILILTFIYISTFLFQYEFALKSTYIGIIVVLLSIILGVIFQSQLIGIMLPKSDFTKNVSRHLEQALIYQSRMKYVHRMGISIYYILLSVGFGLYIYEFAYRDLTFGIIAFFTTMAWVLFSWFYLRKVNIKKQERKINKHIEYLRQAQYSISSISDGDK